MIRIKEVIVVEGKDDTKQILKAVDADTICFQKPNEFWEDLKIKIQENKLLMTYHPHYLYTPYSNFI